VWEPAEPTGRDWLLVHGLASNAQLWDPLAVRLAARGHRAVAVDQRGHGLSDRVSFGYDPHDTSADLLAVVRALGMDTPVAVGQSWGGNVVLHLAATRPDVVAAVVGIDGGTIDLAARFDTFEACWEALAPPRLAGTPLEVVTGMLAERHPGWEPAAIAGVLANFALRPDGTVAPHLRRADHQRILRRLFDNPPRRLYGQVQVPVLLLPVVTSDGDEERTVSKRADVEEAVAALPRARVVWMLDREHDVHAQAPDEVLEVLLAADADGALDG
jgi:pimeloyl-ACP methyl ester carboxylesterase